MHFRVYYVHNKKFDIQGRYDIGNDHLSGLRNTVNILQSDWKKMKWCKLSYIMIWPFEIFAVKLLYILDEFGASEIFSPYMQTLI